MLIFSLTYIFIFNDIHKNKDGITIILSFLIVYMLIFIRLLRKMKKHKKTLQVYYKDYILSTETPEEKLRRLRKNKLNRIL